MIEQRKTGYVGQAGINNPGNEPEPDHPEIRPEQEPWKNDPTHPDRNDPERKDPSRENPKWNEPIGDDDETENEQPDENDVHRNSSEEFIDDSPNL